MKEVIPKGTILIATLLWTAQLTRTKAFRFDGAFATQEQARNAARGAAHILVNHDPEPGDRLIVTMHAIHPAERDACFMSQAINVGRQVAREELVGAVAACLVDGIDDLLRYRHGDDDSAPPIAGTPEGNAPTSSEKH